MSKGSGVLVSCPFHPRVIPRVARGRRGVAGMVAERGSEVDRPGGAGLSVRADGRSGCPVSLDLVRPHLADLRRTTSPETPFNGLSHPIWPAMAIPSVASTGWTFEGEQGGGGIRVTVIVVVGRPGHPAGDLGGRGMVRAVSATVTPGGGAGGVVQVVAQVLAAVADAP